MAFLIFACVLKKRRKPFDPILTLIGGGNGVEVSYHLIHFYTARYRTRYNTPDAAIRQLRGIVRLREIPVDSVGQPSTISKDLIQQVSYRSVSSLRQNICSLIVRIFSRDAFCSASSAVML